MIAAAARSTFLAFLAVALSFALACSGGETATTDDAIRKDLQSTFEARHWDAITVTVKDGVVTLGGTVPDAAAAEQAVQLAQAAKGVVRVDSQLTAGGSTAGPVGGDAPPLPPAPQVETDDQVTAARVKLALLADQKLAGSSVEATVAGGVATLTGTVPSEEAKAAAQRTASSVRGVSSVNNQLQVVQAAVQNIPDAQVAKAVSGVIDREFSALLLTASVSKGVVTVRGAVENRGQILQIADRLKKVEGVKSVDTSLLTVEGGESGDRIGSPTTGKP